MIITQLDTITNPDAFKHPMDEIPLLFWKESLDGTHSKFVEGKKYYHSGYIWTVDNNYCREGDKQLPTMINETGMEWFINKPGYKSIVARYDLTEQTMIYYNPFECEVIKEEYYQLDKNLLYNPNFIVI